MTARPLAIVQARIGSTRLPGKMLLDLGGHPLIWWAWNAAVEAFGVDNVVVAIPASADNDELADALAAFTPNVFRWDGPECDVLGRFHACAHRYRWHPDSVIVRVTPDDPFKEPALMRRVAAGERHPVELGAEAFTLAMLDDAHFGRVGGLDREHLTYAIPCLADPPQPPPGLWTLDTQADLDAARARRRPWLPTRPSP
jgi:spore coat polysaccharide biosynthesis protein SpsF (cytidylyltransferase family)